MVVKISTVVKYKVAEVKYKVAEATDRKSVV